MNIYLIERNQTANFDEARSMVIVAKSPKAARGMAAMNAGDEGPDVWTSKNGSTCVLVGDAHPHANDSPTILCRDFLEG